MTSAANHPLPAQIDALDRATELAARVQQVAGGTDEQLHLAIQGARGAISRAQQRTELSAEHTVVALAGATGSGKSSLLNLLAGAQVAAVGARRPTTAHAQAVVCHTRQGSSAEPAGTENDASALLDWLGISRRTEVSHDRLASAVLVDLPDLDSLHRDHQLRAEHLTQRADVLVWVLDPQKYADAVVHQQYLRPMARHADVMLVVLNQVDTLAATDLPPVLADLTEHLAADGLPGVRVLPTSTTTGAGTEDLVTAISAVVHDRQNMHRRLAADLGTAAEQLAEVCPPAAAPGVTAQLRRRLTAELAAAAGAERVADAVATSFRMTARARTGWPVTRWAGRFRADPLHRLHLGGGGRRPTSQQPTGGYDGQVLTAPSMPEPDPAARAAVGRALTGAADAVVGRAPSPWRHYLRSGVGQSGDAVTAEAQDAISGVLARGPDRRSGRVPSWFGLVGALQWLLLAVLVVGLLWVALVVVLRYLGMGPVWTPQLGPVPAEPPWPALPAIPWPVVLLGGAVLLGVLVAVLAGVAARVGAARRRRRTYRQITEAIGAVAGASVLDPLAARTAEAQEYTRAIAQVVNH